jgi:hypothetical protein
MADSLLRDRESDNYLAMRASYRDDSECATRLSVFRYRSRVRVVAFVQRSFIISPKP